MSSLKNRNVPEDVHSQRQASGFSGEFGHILPCDGSSDVYPEETDDILVALFVEMISRSSRVEWHPILSTYDKFGEDRLKRLLDEFPEL